MASSALEKRLIRAGYIAPGDPLDYAFYSWVSLVELGLARWPPLIEWMSAERFQRFSDQCGHEIDRVCGEVDGLLKVRIEGTQSARPELQPLALEAFRPSPGDPQLAPQIADWLWLERERWEEKALLSKHAWCTTCGHRFVDFRAELGYVARVARWCSFCRPSPTRHLPALRLCAAPNCFTYFRPTRANHVFHRARCKEAARTWTGAPRPARPRGLTFEDWDRLSEA